MPKTLKIRRDENLRQTQKRQLLKSTKKVAVTSKAVENPQKPTKGRDEESKEEYNKKKESKVSTAERNPTCAWFKCDKDNGKPAKARNQSKYCSRDCSNRNARYRMKQRKKARYKIKSIDIRCPSLSKLTEEVTDYKFCLRNSIRPSHPLSHISKTLSKPEGPP